MDHVFRIRQSEIGFHYDVDEVYAEHISFYYEKTTKNRVVGGFGNTVSGSYSAIVSGLCNNVVGNCSVILGGCCNTNPAGINFASVFGKGITASASYALHVNCLVAPTTPLYVPLTYPAGTLMCYPLPAPALGLSAGTKIVIIQ